MTNLAQGNQVNEDANLSSAADINVLHLMDSEGMYGAERVVLELLTVMQKWRAKVAFACLSPFASPGADIGRQVLQRNVPTFFIDERKKFSLRSLFLIRKILRQTRARILHTHGYKATILGGLVARLCHIPLLCTYHGEARHVPELKGYVSIENCFVRKAAKIIAVSRPITNELISRGVSEEKISVIYNGMEDPFNSQSTWLIQNERAFFPHLLCVGRLVTLKRYDLVLDALSILKMRYPEVGLSIAGEGPEENTLKKRADELGLQSSVRFLGYVSNTRPLYDEANIFILSSDTEGTPLALLEAMAASKPIIATAVGSIPDMIVHGQHALIISPGDLRGLIESITNLTIDANYANNMGINARMHFMENFSSEKMATRYLSIYREIMSSNMGINNEQHSD
jgi:glycosyltransferase involved in cell wall biosynthesis